MKSSGSWQKIKSDFSQLLHSFKEGTSTADSIIKQLNQLLADNAPDATAQQELQKLILATQLSQELSNLLLSKIGEKKTQVMGHNTPSVAQQAKAQDKKDSNTAPATHSSSLLSKLSKNDKTTAPRSIRPGLIIRDTYRLEAKIGKGGMGEVWKAVDLIQAEGEADDKFVAIKLINQEIKDHPDALKALVREFSRYKKLIHSNIVKAYELNRDHNDIFIAMEYLEGAELKEFIKQHPQGIPLKQAQPIIKSMCDALEYAHSEGIIHLDFKPGNIFYNPKTQVCKVIDFGIARLSDPEERDKTHFDPGSLGAITTAYASCGMHAEEAPCPEDDIYSLACVIYELLSGRHPFNKTDAIIAERKKMQPSQIPGLSKDEMQAILRGLRFRTTDRTSSAKQLYTELFSARQLAKQKRNKLYIIAPILLVALTAIPLALYTSYDDWKLEQISTRITQLSPDGTKDFLQLSIAEQKQLLQDNPAHALALVEFAASKQDVLQELNKFDGDIQQSLLANRKVKAFLLTHYRNKIGQAISSDNFQLAQQLTEQILKRYPDSSQLNKIYANIDARKQARLANLEQTYQQCLADTSQNLIAIFPCLQQTQALIKQINNTVTPELVPELSERYRQEISDAIAVKETALATELIANWQTLESTEIPERVQLEQQIAHITKVEELITQINTAHADQLHQLITLLAAQGPAILHDVLANTAAKQHLISLYQEFVAKDKTTHHFSSTDELIVTGLTLFPKNSKAHKTLSQLGKQNKQNKARYLANQKQQYLTQLAQKRPDVSLIQSIQKRIADIAPDNPLAQLPKLSANYAKKIETAIMEEQLDLAQQLLTDWQALKPSAPQTEPFIQLSTKQQQQQAALQHLQKASAQLQAAMETNKLAAVNMQLTELAAQFPEADQQDKILRPNKERLFSFYQQHIKSALQHHHFAQAQQAQQQIQTLFPKDKQIAGLKDAISQAQTLYLQQLLQQSRAALNTEPLEGSAIFAPLIAIQAIDKHYFDTQQAVFLEIKQKIMTLINQEKALPQIKSVINQWHSFIQSESISIKNKEQYNSTKNRIALRCLSNGRRLKKQDKMQEAKQFFSYGLSLDPIKTIKNALEKELL